jgi:hypothetical protein
MLPEPYQDRLEDITPVSMGSAGLKYGSDGKVVWDEIWGSFCDLAMASGPPHRGSLLEAATQDEIDLQPDRYRQVVEEICRGITMVTGLLASSSQRSGWIRVTCPSHAMAGWLVRAIVMENVSARQEGRALYLPAGPAYRLEKEIKNVITALAKTCHYWMEHTPIHQQKIIAALLAIMEAEEPLLQPSSLQNSSPSSREMLAQSIVTDTGLFASDDRYAGWLGVPCPTVRAAIWIMRALVVSQVLARREDSVVFLPLDSAADPNGDRVRRALLAVHGLAKFRTIL